MRWQKIVWLIFWTGLILGPGMFAYERLIAGRVAQTVVLFGPEKNAIGSIVRKWMDPATIHLEPSMNPIAFVFDPLIIPGNPVSNENVDSYRMDLTLAGKPVRSDAWDVGFRWSRFEGIRVPIPTYDHRLAVFDVDQAGDYQFKVTKVHDFGTAQINELNLKVLANSYHESSALFWLGMAMFAGPPVFAYFWVTRRGA